MGEKLDNCWEIMECGREPGGENIADFGVCAAAREGLGHSCWAVPNTLCDGEVQGSIAEKEVTCIACEVYMLYHRESGLEGEHIANEFPDEDQKYQSLLRAQMRRA